MSSYYRSSLVRDPDALPVETMSRKYTPAANSVTMTSGFLRLAYFTQPDDQTCTTVILPGGQTAAGATPTLVRGGFYLIDSTGLATLVCAMNSDTSTFSVANTDEAKAFGTAGGLPASYTFRAGQRYAGALLVVTGATAPTIRGGANGISGNMVRAPIVAAAVGSQTDLPTTIAAATLSASGSSAFIQMAAV